MIGGVITFGALWHAMNPDGEVTAMLFYGFSAKSGPRFRRKLDHQKPIWALLGNEPNTDEEPFFFDHFFMTTRLHCDLGAPGHDRVRIHTG